MKLIRFLQDSQLPTMTKTNLSNTSFKSLASLLLGSICLKGDSALSGIKNKNYNLSYNDLLVKPKLAEEFTFWHCSHLILYQEHRLPFQAQISTSSIKEKNYITILLAKKC